ncbi:MAG: hypothetical protein LBJ02_05420 [Bifidobacteriaceae bacterium]|nr:hypothetical protein [Bifidobacteriaceae bacterium]
MSYQTYSLLSAICFAAAGAAGVGAVVLFFSLHVGEAIGVLSGRRSARGIAELQAASAAGKTLGTGQPGHLSPDSSADGEALPAPAAPISRRPAPVVSATSTGTTIMSGAEVAAPVGGPAWLAAPAAPSSPTGTTPMDQPTSPASPATPVEAPALANLTGATATNEAFEAAPGVAARHVSVPPPPSPTGTTVMNEAPQVAPVVAPRHASVPPTPSPTGTTVMNEATPAAPAVAPRHASAPPAASPTGTTVMDLAAQAAVAFRAGQAPPPPVSPTGTTVIGPEQSGEPVQPGGSGEPLDPEEATGTQVVTHFRFSSAKESL